MTRFVAFRVFIVFMTSAALAAITGFASSVPLAEVLFLICAALSGSMLIVALAAPAHAPVPVRVRRRR